MPVHIGVSCIQADDVSGLLLALLRRGLHHDDITLPATTASYSPRSAVPSLVKRVFSSAKGLYNAVLAGGVSDRWAEMLADV